MLDAGGKDSVIVIGNLLLRASSLDFSSGLTRHSFKAAAQLPPGFWVRPERLTQVGQPLAPPPNIFPTPPCPASSLLDLGSGGMLRLKFTRSGFTVYRIR